MINASNVVLPLFFGHDIRCIEFAVVAELKGVLEELPLAGQQRRDDRDRAPWLAIWPLIGRRIGGVG